MDLDSLEYYTTFVWFLSGRRRGGAFRPSVYSTIAILSFCEMMVVETSHA